MAAKKTTAVVKWDEKFAKYAKEGKDQVKNIGAGGIGVRFGHGSITVGGVVVAGGRLKCVVLGSCALNAWNKDKYDADNPQAPDCYAFAVVNDDPGMRPHAKAPLKQADDCATCSKNEFGSAETGKGKACANTIRLGLITAKDAEDADGIRAAELATAKVSPTNLKIFAAYVKAVEEEHGRPLWAVVTEISAHDDPRTQIRLEFKMVEMIEGDAELGALEKRALSIQGALQQPFSAAAERPGKEPKAGASKKFAAKEPAKRR